MATQQISRFDSKHLIDNREMRIFLSSTFTDMKEERSALIKTFESLKIEANRRDVYLSVVDLRWGITEEEVQAGRVLSLCLEEIELCHPFFIGLIGSHYGSSPHMSVLETNPELEERYPWILEDIKHGLSFTEIEIQYGVLRNNNDVDALFFFRDTPSCEPDDNIKLSRLKKQIKEQNRIPKESYTSMEDLCEKVEKGVLNILDKHYPLKEHDRLSHERLTQKAYINSRHRQYQKPIADFQRLDSFLDGDETHLVITGPSGMGKSALIANWLKEKEKTQHSHNIIYHFVGNSFGGSDPEEILQHINDELYDLYGIEQPEGFPEKLDKEAQRILVEAGQKGKPVLIVIDGINQITDHNHSKLLNWLPQAPRTTKYLFSTLEEDETFQTFQRRGYPIHQIGVLDRMSRHEFIVDYLHNVGKKLTSEQIDVILDDSENENMLVLKTLLDELICFGSHLQLDERIKYYLSSSSINDFFDRLLQRMEDDYKEVPRILFLIALTENGVTEDELQRITGLRPLDIHLFYCAFYHNLITRNGLITFAHQYVYEAIWSRYNLSKSEEANPYRQQFIDYISTDNTVSKTRLISELAFQYYHTDNAENLYSTILSFEAFHYFNSSDKGNATLARYWRKLLDRNPDNYNLENYLFLPDNNITIENSPYLNLGQFIQTYFGDSETAFMYYQSFLFKYLDGEDSNSIDIAISCNNIGTIYDDLENYEGALGYYSKALEIEEKILGENHSTTAATYCNIGTVFRNLGDYQNALDYYFKDMSICEIVLGPNHFSTATPYNNIGMVYSDLGDYDKALEFYFKALQIWENVLGLDHPNTATSYNNIAGAFYNKCDYPQALEYYYKDLAICERVLGPNHPSTATTYNNIGLVYFDLGDYDKALESYDKALDIYKKAFSSDNLSIATSFNNIATVFHIQGDLTKALDYYFRALHIKEKELGTEHDDIATAYNNIGMAYSDQKVYDKALMYYFRALGIITATFGEEHPYTASIYNNIGTVYESQGKYPALSILLTAALEYYFKGP